MSFTGRRTKRGSVCAQWGWRIPTRLPVAKCASARRSRDFAVVMDLKFRNSENREVQFTETEWVSFKGSAIHGLGGFARRPIPSGARIIEYVGEKITKSESLERCERNNEYIFALDDKHDID